MEKFTNYDAITIWDSDKSPTSSPDKTVLWSSFTNSDVDQSFSIPTYLEKNGQKVRDLYLGWIYHLGKLSTNHGTIIDTLKLKDGFSYWWLTLLFEKSNFSKSPNINEAVKFLAFKDWVSDKEIYQLNLYSSNPKLIKCFKTWCSNHKIEFSFTLIQKDKPNSILINTFNRLPYAVQGLAKLLSFIVKRWCLKGVGLKKWKESKAKHTFVSYFTYLKNNDKTGAYQSDYWGTLPDLLNQNSIGTNWIHFYIHSKSASTPKKAIPLLNTFNHTTNQNHVFIESFISLKLIFKTLVWWTFLKKKVKSNDCDIPFSIKEHPELWAFHMDDYKESIYGGTAPLNILYYLLFNKAISFLPKQSKAFYLREGHAWEAAFIHTWRQKQRTSVLGVPHSTVRFWDLRYHNTFNTYREYREHILPDYIVSNGSLSWNAITLSDYPQEKILKAEALRYLYLTKSLSPQEHSKSIDDTILVLGDFDKENLASLLNLICKINAATLNQFNFIIKPHPYGQLDEWNYPQLKFKVSMSPLSEILKLSSLVIAGGATSAAIDAIYANKHVITVLDPKTLNMSPLYLSKGYQFVTNPAELEKAILSANNNTNVQNLDLLNLNPKLDRWLKLIEDESL